MTFQRSSTLTNCAFVIALLVYLTDAHQVQLKNSCGKGLKAFSLENGEGKQREAIDIEAGRDATRELPNGWAGRFFARYSDTDEFTDGQPYSLAEIKFDGDQGQDFYDISLVDGFSTPLKISPNMDSVAKDESNEKSCKTIQCSHDFIANCPEPLKLKQGENVVACQSACTKFKSQEFCCTGAHNKPETCPQNEYGAIFKSACPDAYSYAYDDKTSTFVCKSGEGKSSGYVIEFCG